MRSRLAAIRWAREQVDSPVKDFTGLCLQFVRMAFDLPAVHPSAGAAWRAAKRKHRTTDANTIPRGVPVFWETPSEFEHIALSLGGGLCLSTDVRRRGRVDVVRIDAIRTAWGAQLLGWTEDLNGQTVWQNKPKAPPAPPAPERTNVSRAREQLRVARRCVAIAERFLDQAPEEREVVHNVADTLDQLERAISGRLGKAAEAMSSERLAFAVVLIVGAVLVLSVGLIGLISWQQLPIPDVLQNVAIGALTGLLGLLIKPPART